MGADLACAINEWKDADSEKVTARNRAEQPRLIGLARRDMDGNE